MDGNETTYLPPGVIRLTDEPLVVALKRHFAELCERETGLCAELESVRGRKRQIAEEIMPVIRS